MENTDKPLSEPWGLSTLPHQACGPHASNSRRGELPSQQELSVLRSQANKTFIEGHCSRKTSRAWTCDPKAPCVIPS
jgi:hypothetical protein